MNRLHAPNSSAESISLSDLAQVALGSLSRASAASPVEVRAILEALRAADSMQLNVSRLFDALSAYRGVHFVQGPRIQCSESKPWLPCLWKRLLSATAVIAKERGARVPTAVAAAVPLRTMMQAAHYLS